MIEDATFPWESYWRSYVDPASAQAPRAFACSNAYGFSRLAKVRLRSPHTALSAQDDAYGAFLTKILTWTVEDAGPYNLRRTLSETNFKMLSSVKEK